MRPAEPKLANIAMAIFHAQVSVISRGAGQSACGSAAYCAGEKIRCERLDISHDHSRKSGVDYSEIISPIVDGIRFDGSRSELWNLVEASEKRHDSQLARMIVVAIPVELNDRSKIALVREFVTDNFVSKGMIADINIHDIDSHNPHAHIMLSMRDLVKSSEGKIEFGQKNRGWNDRALVKQQRENWAAVANKYLAQVGDARIDHRSLADRGSDHVPQIHLGSSANAMEKRGIKTRRGDRHREINILNLAIDLGHQKIKDIDREINIENYQQSQEAERQRIEAEIRQREEAQRKQRLEAENQRWAIERRQKLESEKLLEDLKQKLDRDANETFASLELKLEQLNQRVKQSKDTVVTPIPEIKETIKLEQPKFTVEWLTAAFTQMRDESPQGQQCTISAVVDNFLAKAVEDDPTNKLGLERMIFRIKDDGRRKGSGFMPLDKLVDEIKFVTEHPSQRTTIQTTRSKNVDDSEPEGESQSQEYSM